MAVKRILRDETGLITGVETPDRPIGPTGSELAIGAAGFQVGKAEAERDALRAQLAEARRELAEARAESVRNLREAQASAGRSVAAAKADGQRMTETAATYATNAHADAIRQIGAERDEALDVIKRASRAAVDVAEAAFTLGAEAGVREAVRALDPDGRREVALTSIDGRVRGEIADVFARRMNGDPARLVPANAGPAPDLVTVGVGPAADAA